MWFSLIILCSTWCTFFSPFLLFIYLLKKRWHFANTKGVLMKYLLTLFIILLTTAKITASPLLFKQIKAKGSGCPKGSVESVVSPNAEVLSLLFSEMSVEVPQYSGENENDDISDDNPERSSRSNPFLANKICKISFITDIPRGEMIDSIEISSDFRGMTYMDKHTKALFSSNLLEVAGPRRYSHRIKNILARKVWRKAEVDEDWTISGTKKIQLEGTCAQQNKSSYKLILKNIIKAKINKKGQEEGANALITLDTADFSGKMSFKFNTRPCTQTQPNRDITPPTRTRCKPGYRLSRRTNRCVRIVNRRGRTPRRRNR
jgi:hypothetical protein